MRTKTEIRRKEVDVIGGIATEEIGIEEIGETVGIEIEEIVTEIEIDERETVIEIGTDKKAVVVVQTQLR